MKDLGWAELVLLFLAVVFVALAFFAYVAWLALTMGHDLLFRLVTELSPYVEVGAFVSLAEPTSHQLKMLGWLLSSLIVFDTMIEAFSSAER